MAGECWRWLEGGLAGGHFSAQTRKLPDLNKCFALHQKRYRLACSPLISIRPPKPYQSSSGPPGGVLKHFWKSFRAQRMGLKVFLDILQGPPQTGAERFLEISLGPKAFPTILQPHPVVSPKGFPRILQPWKSIRAHRVWLKDFWG